MAGATAGLQLRYHYEFAVSVRLRLEVAVESVRYMGFDNFVHSYTMKCYRETYHSFDVITGMNATRNGYI